MPEVKIVNSMDELATIFPPGTITIHSRGHLMSPCPFCDSEGQEFTYKLLDSEVTVSGEDRLAWFDNSDTDRMPVFYCNQENRGYNIDQLIEKLSSGGLPIDLGADFFDHVQASPAIWPTRSGGRFNLPRERTVVRLHRLADFYQYHLWSRTHEGMVDFWRETAGWDQSVIDEAMLFRHVFDGSHHTPAYIMPLPVVDLENNIDEENPLYLFASRLPDGAKRHSRGDRPDSLVVYRENDPEDRNVWIVEGEKDFITAAYVFRRNVLALLGTGWARRPETLSQIRSFIMFRGYNTAILCGDNDQPGRVQFNGQISRILSDTTCRLLEWPDGSVVGYDITDLNRDLGGEEAYRFILDNLVLYERTEELETVHQPPMDFVPTVDYLRDPENQESLYAVLRDYLNSETNNNLLLLQVGAGAGKTRITMEVLADLVRQQAPARLEKYERLKEEYEAYMARLPFLSGEELELGIRKAENLKSRLDNFSYNIAATFTPFKTSVATIQNFAQVIGNMDDWFFFEARNNNNCEMYDTVDQMGSNFHVIGKYCEGFCPVRELCSRRGYLSQKIARLGKYLVSLNHRHLHDPLTRSSNLHAMVIDENPLSLVSDDFITINSTNDFLPHTPTWDMDINDPLQQGMVGYVELLVSSLNKTLSSLSKDAIMKDEYEQVSSIVYGGELLHNLNEEIIRSSDGAVTLSEVLTEDTVDIISNFYQPTYSGHGAVLPRPLPGVVSRLLEELPEYLTHWPQQLNSNIAFFRGGEEGSGTLYVNMGKPFKFPRKTKIVVLDATASSMFYELAFPGRNIRVYAPQFRNPNAEIIQAVGSNYTKQAVEGAIAQRANRKVYTEDIPVSVDMYGNKTLLRVREIVKTLFKRHESLLVIFRGMSTTTSLLEPALRRYIGEHDDKRLSFLYYGSNEAKGVNDYENFEAVVAFGRFRPPETILHRRAVVWSRLSNNTQLLDREPVQKPLVISSYDNSSQQQIEYRTYDDPLTDELILNTEWAELVQALSRIRFNSVDTKKYIYIFSDVPFIQYLNRVVPYQQFLDEMAIGDEEVTRLLTFIQERRSMGLNDPTYSEIRDILYGGQISTAAIRILKEKVNKLLDETS